MPDPAPLRLGPEVSARGRTTPRPGGRTQRAITRAATRAKVLVQRQEAGTNGFPCGGHQAKYRQKADDRGRPPAATTAPPTSWPAAPGWPCAARGPASPCALLAMAIRMVSVMMMPMSTMVPMAMAMPDRATMLACDAEELHRDEGHQHRQGQHRRDDQRSCQVPRIMTSTTMMVISDFLGQGELCRVPRVSPNQPGTVVEGNHVDLADTVPSGRVLRGRPGEISAMLFFLTGLLRGGFPRTAPRPRRPPLRRRLYPVLRAATAGPRETPATVFTEDGNVIFKPDQGVFKVLDAWQKPRPRITYSTRLTSMVRAPTSTLAPAHRIEQPPPG